MLLLLIGCARSPAVSVRSPARGAPAKIEARWTLTAPDYVGRVEADSVGSSIYVLHCGANKLDLRKLTKHGDVEWERQLEHDCSLSTRAIAATARGVVLAVQAAPGARVLRFDAAGEQLFERVLTGRVRHLGVAAFGERAAICFDSQGDARLGGEPLARGYWALELDSRATTSSGHLISPVYDPFARCGYDADGDLWAVVHWGRAGQGVRVGAQTRDFAPGTWAIRLGERPRFLRVYDGASSWVTPMPTGFVVHDYRKRAFFVDRGGEQRWQLDLPDRGCWISPSPIAASKGKLVAALDIFCAERGGASRIADLSIRDRSAPDGPLARYTLIVEYDAVARRTTKMLEVSPPSKGRARYLAVDDQLVAFGSFSGALGFGADIRSGPPSYRCDSNLPTDAQTWDSYETENPECRSGYHLRTSYPTWPFVTSLAR